MPRPDGFALPAEVRRVRAWWLREARDHLRKARGIACTRGPAPKRPAKYGPASETLCGCMRHWHIGQAVQARGYARGVVDHHFRGGQ